MQLDRMNLLKAAYRPKKRYFLIKPNVATPELFELLCKQFVHLHGIVDFGKAGIKLIKTTESKELVIKVNLSHVRLPK